MTIRTLKTIVLMGIFLGLIIGGCGPKPIDKESHLDTPDNHYNQGLRELDRGNFDAAAGEFQRATDLDLDYPGGYVGLGLVWAERGDFKEALKQVDKGLKKDDTFIDGYIAKGNIITKQRKDDDWLKDAVKQFGELLATLERRNEAQGPEDRL